MTSLIAKMRNVHDGGGVIRDQADFRTALKRHHALAQAQNGQGAQKAKGINFQIHSEGIMGMFQPVHRDVTARPRDAAEPIG